MIRFSFLRVTPFVGVWIETRMVELTDHKGNVTPFVGVWIETSPLASLIPQKPVTPFVGVWIETDQEPLQDAFREGHTLRGCVD